MGGRAKKRRTTFHRLHCFRILFIFCLYILLRNCNKSREHFSKACSVLRIGLAVKNVKHFTFSREKPLPGGKLFALVVEIESVYSQATEFFTLSCSHRIQLRYRCSFHNIANSRRKKFLGEFFTPDSRMWQSSIAPRFSNVTNKSLVEKRIKLLVKLEVSSANEFYFYGS